MAAVEPCIHVHILYTSKHRVYIAGESLQQAIGIIEVYIYMYVQKQESIPKVPNYTQTFTYVGEELRYREPIHVQMKPHHTECGEWYK